MCGLEEIEYVQVIQVFVGQPLDTLKHHDENRVNLKVSKNL